MIDARHNHFSSARRESPKNHPVWHKRCDVRVFQQPVNAESVYWPTAETFEKEEVFQGETEGGWYYSAFNFSASEHGGTHLDAPIHFAEGGNTADQNPVDQLIGPGFVIDVTDKAASDVDYRVSAADIEAFEAEHGQIPEGAIVLINTGRAPLYPDREQYMGTAERGEAAVAELHFPGLGMDGAELLVSRGIGAVGIDTPSIDHGQSTGFRHPCRTHDEQCPRVRERGRHVGAAGRRRNHRGPADQDRRASARMIGHDAR